MDINRDEIIRLTGEYGGEWGINHTRRLLKLVDEIGDDRPYNSEAVWLAAHLHDWGGYDYWSRPGTDHAQRSREVAEELLTARRCPEPLLSLVLECIELHHCSGGHQSLEAVLLRDADVLDFLGVVGVLRDFSKNPRDMRKAFSIARKRRQELPGMLVLEKAKEMAKARVKQMDQLLELFEAESFGHY